MQSGKGSFGVQPRKAKQTQRKVASKKNVPMGQATFGQLEGFSAAPKSEIKFGSKGNAFPERKLSSNVSNSPLLYETEGFTYGGFKPPPNNKNKSEVKHNIRKPQQQGKALDPIGTVSDTQQPVWSMSSGGQLSGKRTMAFEGGSSASPARQTLSPVKQRAGLSPSRSLYSPSKSPERLTGTLTLEGLGGGGDTNQGIQFPSSKSVLPDIPHTTDPDQQAEEMDTLNDTLKSNKSVSPSHRRASMKPDDVDALTDTLFRNVSISPQRRPSVKPDMDQVEDLTSTIGSVGSKRRNSVKPGAVQSEKTAREIAALEGVLSGEIEQILPPLKSSTIRIFLSSTFSDFKMERNLLAQKVYPELELYCQDLGLKFEVVDLRWGITDEVANEHLVEKLCLLEVKNCKSISPNLNFMAMLGQRYGYRSLPPEIESVEFEALRDIAQTQNISGCHLMEVWYKLDTNSRPPVYMLQPIKAVIPDYAEPEAEARAKGSKQWDQQKSELQGCLRNAAKESSLDEIRKDKYFISVTEQEIIAGILLSKGLVSDSLCFTRTLKGLEDDLEACMTRKFIDAGLMEGKYFSCTESKDFQSSLRNKIQSVLPNENCAQYETTWTTDGITLNEPSHLEYLHTFCDDVKDKIKAAITERVGETQQRDEDLMSQFSSLLTMKCQSKKKTTNGKKSTAGQPKGLTEADFMMGLHSVKQLQQEMNRYGDDKVEKLFLTKGIEVYEEILHHLHFAQNKLAIFTGREKELGMIEVYLKQMDKTQSPFLIHAPPGHGKTAFMASIAKKVKVFLKNSVVVARFLGTSSTSSSVRQTINSLCHHICMAYAIEVDMNALARESRARLYLQDLLTIVSHQYGNSKPLVIFLEAIDILHTEGTPNSLAWLPCQLPPFVGMFVSVQSDTVSHKLMKDKLTSPSNELKLGNLSVEDVGHLVDNYYESNKRNVTEDQKRVVLDLLAKSPVPLYCNLVLEATLSWKSYTNIDKQILPETVAIAVKNMFINLEGKYGLQFIKAALGYISVCKDGISEKELDDVLSMNNAVLDEAYKYHNPPTEGVVRMPPLMWARLKHDLRHYLGRKLVYKVTTVCWYYQEFMEMALDIYVSNAVRKQLHMDFVQLFSVEEACLRTVTLSQRKLTIENANRLVSVQPMTAKNRRKLSCLLFHYRRSGNIEGMKRNLFLHCKYLSCFIDAFGMDELLETLAAVQSHLKDEDIAEVLKAIRFSHREISGKPEILGSQLLCYLKEIRSDKPELDRMCQTIEQNMEQPALLPTINCIGSSQGGLLFAIGNVSKLQGTPGVDFSVAVVRKGDIQVIGHDANHLKTICPDRAAGVPIAMQVAKNGEILIALFSDSVHLYGPELLRKFSNRANSAENLNSSLCISDDLSMIYLASKGRLGAFENAGKQFNDYDYKPKAAMNLGGSTKLYDLVILDEATTVSTHMIQVQKGSKMGAVICWNHRDQAISAKVGLPSLPVCGFLFVTNLSQFIICGCENGQIFLVDTTAGKIVNDFQLKPVKLKLTSFPCDFDKGQGLLVASFPDNSARIWSIANGTASSLKVVKYTDVATAIGLNSELGTIVAGVRGGGMVMNDFNKDKQVILNAYKSSDISMLQCTKHSSMLTLSSSGELKLWDSEILQAMMDSDKKPQDFEAGSSGLSGKTDLSCFTFTPESKHLITGSSSTSLAWNVDNGCQIKKLENINGGSKMGSINVSDIPRLVVLQNDKLMVLNLDTNEIIDNLDTAYDFKAYSDNLFAIGTTPDHRPALLLYDWDQHYLVDSVTLLPSDLDIQGAIKGKLFEDLDDLVLVRISHGDETSSQCHIVAVKQESNGHFHQAVVVKSFKEEKLAVNLGKQTALLMGRSVADLWKPFEGSSATSKVPELQQFLKNNKLACTCVLSCDHNMLAIGSESGKILICGNPANGDGVKPVTLKGHRNKVTCLRFLGDSRHVISGSLDRRMMVWNVDTGTVMQQIYTHAPALHLQLSPDSSHLAVLAKVDEGNKAFLFKMQ